MNKLISVVVIVVLLGIGGWWYLNKDRAATSEEPQEEMVASEENSENTDTESIEATQGSTGNTSSLPGSTGAGVSGSVSLEGDMISEVIVTYTDSGFSPETATINKGQTVKFMNNSSRGMWVASDPHPVHTNYPEKTSLDCKGSAFDACKNIPVGGSYSFTFSETGTWSYHNHTQASHKGTIVVE